MFFFSSRRRHTRCALVTGVQTCALPICRHHGERTAIIEGDKRLSYAALHDRAGRCAGLFRSLGVGEEDRVCILALNSHRNLEALFGAIWAGGIAAPLNYRLSPAELVGKIGRAHV